MDDNRLYRSRDGGDRKTEFSTMRVSDLSSARASLLEACHHLYYGEILDLQVLDGQPVLDPRPRLVREIKFGSQGEPRRETALADFALKDQQIELIKALSEIGDGVIDRIEVKHGLPFRLVVSEQD